MEYNFGDVLNKMMTFCSLIHVPFSIIANSGFQYLLLSDRIYLTLHVGLLPNHVHMTADFTSISDA